MESRRPVRRVQSSQPSNRRSIVQRNINNYETRISQTRHGQYYEENENHNRSRPSFRKDGRNMIQMPITNIDTYQHETVVNRRTIPTQYGEYPRQSLQEKRPSQLERESLESRYRKVQTKNEQLKLEKRRSLQEIESQERRYQELLAENRRLEKRITDNGRKLADDRQERLSRINQREGEMGGLQKQIDRQQYSTRKPVNAYGRLPSEVERVKSQRICPIHGTQLSEKETKSEYYNTDPTRTPSIRPTQASPLTRSTQVPQLIRSTPTSEPPSDKPRSKSSKPGDKNSKEEKWRSTFPKLPTLILSIVQCILTILIFILEIASLAAVLYRPTGAGMTYSIPFLITSYVTFILVRKKDASRRWATIAFIAQLALLIYDFIFIGITGNYVQSGILDLSSNSHVTKYKIMQAQLTLSILLMFSGFAYVGLYVYVTIVALWRDYHTLDIGLLFHEL